jgi:hypothetical protein
MNLEISSETEARLLEKARQMGLSVDALLQSLLSNTGGAQGEEGVREIPAWDLGVSGGLRRTDIYDDAY